MHDIRNGNPWIHELIAERPQAFWFVSVDVPFVYIVLVNFT